jgi:DNA invertase Pin-like site-specific DNA recombinase
MNAADIQFHNRNFGYARVSTDDQSLSLQVDALIRFGVEPNDIFTDKISGAKEDRPGLTKCLSTLRPGDTLVVWRLDRLGRSMRHLVTLVEDLRQNKIGFKSINDGAIDTTSASGELIFNIFSALAQFERRLIQERTKAGLAAARARGKKGGRRPLPASTPRVMLAKKLHRDKKCERERHLSNASDLKDDILSLLENGRRSRQFP